MGFNARLDTFGIKLNIPKPRPKTFTRPGQTRNETAIQFFEHDAALSSVPDAVLRWWLELAEEGQIELVPSTSTSAPTSRISRRQVYRDRGGIYYSPIRMGE